MKLTFTATYEFDIKEERARISKCFRGPKWKGARDRQRAILDAAEAGDIRKVFKLYYKLPRCSVNGYHEGEYTGLWLSHMGDMLGKINRYKVEDMRLTK